MYRLPGKYEHLLAVFIDKDTQKVERIGSGHLNVPFPVVPEMK